MPIPPEPTIADAPPSCLAAGIARAVLRDLVDRPEPADRYLTALRARRELLAAEHADLAERIADVAGDAGARYLRLWAGEQMPHQHAAGAALAAAEAAHHRHRIARGVGALDPPKPESGHAVSAEAAAEAAACAALERAVTDLLQVHRQVAAEAMERMHAAGGHYGGHRDHAAAMAAAVREAWQQRGAGLDPDPIAPAEARESFLPRTTVLRHSASPTCDRPIPELPGEPP
ncbi:hypothetical protein HS041_29240 [Planomonospora sp. ID67723]|uniref:hypothetical protein n=1 Tax=Planomonospora sp. ID67723 TaxID=2738134 RepID=UPI0018C38D63|nr:hypothetical protein [Planomonospora sp. ID67723]MBG0831806.1 hypothetical protein [Planomonospora sp. ID67723]